MSGASVQPLLLTKATLESLTAVPKPVLEALERQLDFFRASVAPGLLATDDKRQLERRLSTVLGLAQSWRIAYLQQLTAMVADLHDLEAVFDMAGRYVVDTVVPKVEAIWGASAASAFRQAWLYEYRILRMVTADPEKLYAKLQALEPAEVVELEMSSAKSDVLQTCIAMATEGDLTEWTLAGGRTACRLARTVSLERFANVQHMMGVMDLARAKRKVPARIPALVPTNG